MDDSPEPTLFFEQLKEAREGYFVEYSPPGGDVRFACLTLVFHEGTTPEHAKHAMEQEAAVWTRRYPVPVMVSSCDEKGDTVQLSQAWGENNLISWICPDERIEKHWELLKHEEIPEVALSTEYLLDVYEGVPYRTAEEVKQQANVSSKERAKELRMGFAIIFGWAVVVPATVAVLGWTNPVVGFIVTAYALGKAARQGGLMLGWFEPSAREKENREKEQRMRHYFYHCERNQNGFRRLVAENCEHDERAEIEREAQELRKASSRRD